MNTAQQVDILSPQFKANPFPLLARLRAEQPVCRITLPDKTPVWLVTRYKDVKTLLTDERFAKSRYNALTPEQLRKQPWVPPMFRPLERTMVDLDPPDHTRLRQFVHKAFTPRLIEQMQDRVQTLANDLLDAVARKGEMDLIREYALPLPMTIITEILGVPVQDRDKFHKWSKVIVAVDQFNANWRVIPAIWKFNRYLRGHFKARRADLRDDLVSALIQAEEAGDRLSEDELLAMTFLLLVAGHETTVNLIGSGALELLQHPDQMNKLRRDSSLIKSAVEELLRYTAPVFMSTERYAREDVTIQGVTISRGEMTLGVIGSANRDETVFENPDILDIEREPNKHLSFGHGIHYCLGAALARLEAQIAINTLLERMPNLRLKGSPESLRWRRSLILRGLAALPVEI
ncbi:MAG TPA: cytochrome P450 [Blastocatellia bacterium]|jgi:Cytochrome P450